MSRILMIIVAAFAVGSLGACADIGKGKGKGKAPEPVMAAPPPAPTAVYKN